MAQELKIQKDFFSDFPPIEKGSLYILGTPIGNLADISLRALHVLSQVDWILCEDTRQTMKLLRKYSPLIGEKKALKSYRIAHKEKDLAWLCQKLEENSSIAFCSDAGTPGISDPGADLVRRAREKNLGKVIPVPGPSALSLALSLSGWQSNPSLFTGFLSTAPGRRRKALRELSDFSGLIVIYESVHRIKKLMGEMKEIFYGRDILIAREMTKVHEEFLLFKTTESASWEGKLANMPCKGEFTVLVAPKRKLSTSF